MRGTEGARSIGVEVIIIKIMSILPLAVWVTDYNNWLIDHKLLVPLGLQPAPIADKKTKKLFESMTEQFLAIHKDRDQRDRAALLIRKHFLVASAGDDDKDITIVFKDRKTTYQISYCDRRPNNRL